MLFAYLLARDLGYPSGERLLSDLSSSEFETWKAVWQVQPFGPRIDTLMSAQLACLFANTNRRPNTRPFDVAEFIPKTKPPDIREQVIAVFKQFPRKRNG